MAVSKYFCCFVFYSFLGWIWESCYCTTKDKGWKNRGFLYGPIIPIYGFGAIMGTVIYYLTISGPFKNINVIGLFFLCMALSAVLEYVTSYALEKMFHTVWWDYSRLPLNINGRVSLPTATGFGIGGVLIVRFLVPWVEGICANISVPTFEWVSLILMGLLGMDLALTVSALNSFNKTVERTNAKINEKIAIAIAESSEKNEEIIAAIKEKIRKEHIELMLKEAMPYVRSQMNHIRGFRHKEVSVRDLAHSARDIVYNKRMSFKKEKH